MASFRFALALVALSSLGAWCTAAEAQDPEDDAAARRAFRLGEAHYANGEFAQAAEQFEEAYRLSGRPRLMFNAYLAYRDMQDLPNSARTLRRFLDETEDLPAGERDQLTARLAAIERAMEQSGAGTTDGSTTGSEDTGDAGTDTSESDTSTGSTGSDTATPPATGGGGGFSPSPVGFVVAGAGVALGVAAIITGVMSSSDLSTLEERCSNDVCPDDPELRDAHSRGQTLALVTDVFWISGVVALGAGVALIFALQEGGDDSASAGMGCTPEGCFGTVQGRF